MTTIVINVSDGDLATPGGGCLFVFQTFLWFLFYDCMYLTMFRINIFISRSLSKIDQISFIRSFFHVLHWTDVLRHSCWSVLWPPCGKNVKKFKSGFMFSIVIDCDCKMEQKIFSCLFIHFPAAENIWDVIQVELCSESWEIPKIYDWQVSDWVKLKGKFVKTGNILKEERNIWYFERIPSNPEDSSQLLFKVSWG